MLKLIPLALLYLLSSYTHAASKPYSLNMNAGVLYDDNVARAVLSQDIVNDTIINLGASANYSFHQSDHSLITLTAGVDAFQYQDFDKLSNISLNTRVDYELQPHHGFTAPWYMISFEYSYLDFQSSLRDSHGFALELSAGKRLTDRIQLRTGLVIESYSADVDEFDNDSQRLYISGDYKLSNQDTAYLTLAYTDGNTTTSTTDQTTETSKLSPVRRYGHHLPNEVNLAPLRADDAFNNGFVYQLDTTAYSLQIGDNHALSSHQSLDLSLFYYNSDSFGDNSYDGIILQFSYLHRFE